MSTPYFDNTLSSYMYIISKIDPSSTSECFNSDRTSVCVYLTGVPVGYYSDIFTTKVLANNLLFTYYTHFFCPGHCGTCVTTFTVCCVPT